MSEPNSQIEPYVVERARQALDGIETPTPWVAKWGGVYGTSGLKSTYRGTDGSPSVATAEGGFVEGEFMEGDADFIAAAPDLVSQLVAEVEANWQRVVDVEDERDAAVVRAEAAEASLTQWKRATRLCQESRGRLWQARGVAIARAEAAEADLADVLDDADDFETVVRDEPERVLRAAEDVALRKGHDPDTLYTVMDVAEHLAEEADRLEREHAETAARDRLIEKAEAALTRIISGNVTAGYPRNAAASILAEYPGVINVLAEQEKVAAERSREALVMDVAEHLTEEADRMEREHGETTKRDWLVEKLESATREAVETVAGAFKRAGIVDDAGWESLVNLDYTEAVESVADRLLAEAVDQ